MAKSVRWIIVAGAVLFVFLAVIVLLQKIEKNKVVSSVRQIVSNYDKSAKLKYEKFEVEGFFKPKAITCYKCKIQSNKLDLSVDKLHIKISENHKYDINYDGIDIDDNYIQRVILIQSKLPLAIN